MKTKRRRTIDDHFPRMVRIVKPAEQGVAKVEHFTVNEQQSAFTRIRSMRPGARYDEVPAGTYARLIVQGQLMMTDTRMERWTNFHFLQAANGRVLVAGLGLGMVIHAAIKKPEVTHITVIEKYQDVVDLIGPTLKKYGRRVSVVTADALEWKPAKDEKWDTIYFDIWPDVCEDNLETAARLSRRYARRLNRANGKAWMGGWRIEELRARRDANRDRGGWR